MPEEINFKKSKSKHLIYKNTQIHSNTLKFTYF